MLLKFVCTGSDKAVKNFSERVKALGERYVQELKAKPRNHGAPWNNSDDFELLQCLSHEIEYRYVSEIAEEMGRTPYAIACRLNHLLPNFNWETWVADDSSESQNVDFDFFCYEEID